MNTAVKISPDIVAQYRKNILYKKTSGCMFLKIDGNEFIVEKEYAANELEFDVLLKELPKNECRYILYEHDYIGGKKHVSYKAVILICWFPDNTFMGSRMVYTSLKEYVKRSFNGVTLDVQANNLSDFDKQSIDDKIRQRTDL